MKEVNFKPGTFVKLILARFNSINVPPLYTREGVPLRMDPGNAKLVFIVSSSMKLKSHAGSWVGQLVLHDGRLCYICVAPDFWGLKVYQVVK